MGKIFNALEKFTKERETGGHSGRISRADWDVLLRYDRQTGKLDVHDSAVIRSQNAVKRLVTYRLIQADGTLTPAGRVKCAELERQRQGLDAISTMAAEAEAVFGEDVHTLTSDELVDALEAPEDSPEPEPSRLAIEPRSEFIEPFEPEEKTVAAAVKPEAIEEPAEIKPAPAAVAKQAVLEPAEPEPVVKETLPAAGLPAVEKELESPAFQEPSAPAAREDLQLEDWEALLQYDPANGKLDVNNPAIIKDPAIVRRLLDHQMIVYGGKLTAAAIQKCDQLERAKQKTNVAANAVSQKASKKKKSLHKAAVPEPFKIKPPVEKALEKKDITVPVGSPLQASSAGDPNLVSLHRPQSFEAEQFKILRTNLLYPVSGSAPRSIMVTSAEPDEGKSFVASNLAISVARGINRYVLLMDCDLRRPSIHSKFGFGNVPGLSDYLSNGTPLHSLLLKTKVENLTILPAGETPDNPSELLSSERMEALIDEVTERYPDRLIILDSPPPKLTAESSVLARRVDGVLLVVKFGETKREVVHELVDTIGRDKIIGSIINNFDMRSSNYYAKHYARYKT